MSRWKTTGHSRVTSTSLWATLACGKERYAILAIRCVRTWLRRLMTSQPVTVELLYSDQVGRQRTISRFGLTPAGDSWIAALNRHWYLDWEGPRPDSLTLAAVEMVIRDQEAAAQRRSSSDGEQNP